MIRTIDIPRTATLDDYAAHVSLMQAVRTLRTIAGDLVEPLRGRTLWMVNSTEEGGGVAEMMPKLVVLLRELGLHTEWAVIGTDDSRFFDLTKRIHNMLHGVGDPRLTAEEHAVYEQVSRQLAETFQPWLKPDDLLVVHDPQPLGMGALLKETVGLPCVWRCHIGLDHETPATRAAWSFLEPWARRYDHAVFTVRDYAPDFLSDRASVIPPAIDPHSDKNRVLSVHKLSGILSNAALASANGLTLTYPYAMQAQRLQADGSFAPATEPDDLGLLFRPFVLQVSRWDRLKGFGPLMDGFAYMKTKLHANGRSLAAHHRRRLDLVRLVMAGPDPASIQDDPEGLEVFKDLCARWQALDPEVRRDVAFIVLPMSSRKDNALMVNALQRCATIVAQNSLREGFGLTVTEAMWKGRPVLGTHAVGLREQVRPGVEGLLVDDPEDPVEIAETLDEMLAHPELREVWARNAQRRVVENYLVFAQAQRWLEVLNQTLVEAKEEEQGLEER